MAVSRNGRLESRGLVLIGFAEAYAAIETAWSLQEAGFAVAAFTRRGAKPALRRVRGVELHEVTAPESTVAATARDVEHLLRSLRPVAYMPLDDGAVHLTAALDTGDVVVAGPTGSAIE